MMSWENDFVARLSQVQLGDVFNPYADRCQVHDLPNAPAIRSSNLATVIRERHAAHVDSIWFGRDLGYRGGRRTGLALTDEVRMLEESSDDHMFVKATKGSIVGERTAAVIWSVIGRMRCAPFLWNAFPFHPHQPDSQFTNRAHSVSERRATVWAIEDLITHFDNPRLIAIGKDASKALKELGFAHDSVRHPSYGGQREFIAQIEKLYGLPPIMGDAREAILL